MLLWFKDNLATLIVGILMAALLAGVIYHMVRNKKQGKSSCGCSGCSGCSGGCTKQVH